VALWFFMVFNFTKRYICDVKGGAIYYILIFGIGLNVKIPQGSEQERG
jgi:hypothetical protein